MSEGYINAWIDVVQWNLQEYVNFRATAKKFAPNGFRQFLRLLYELKVDYDGDDLSGEQWKFSASVLQRTSIKVDEYDWSAWKVLLVRVPPASFKSDQLEEMLDRRKKELEPEHVET